MRPDTSTDPAEPDPLQAKSALLGLSPLKPRRRFESNLPSGEHSWEHGAEDVGIVHTARVRREGQT